MRRSILPLLVVLFAFACTKGPTEVASNVVPTADLDSVVVISGTSVMLKGVVNPGGIPASYHFEYGTTVSYGNATPSGDAGSGFDPVQVSATVSNLTPGSTYHVRLVAINSYGVGASHDTTFMGARELLIPQDVGTSWEYRFSDGWGGTPYYKRWGLHTWSITSRSISGPDTMLQICDIQSDSLQVLDPFPETATFTVDTVYFTAMISADSVSFPEPRTDPFNPTTPAVSRALLMNSDTLSVPIRGGNIRFVNRVGLIQYSFYFESGHTTAATSLDLVAATIKK